MGGRRAARTPARRLRDRGDGPAHPVSSRSPDDALEAWLALLSSHGALEPTSNHSLCPYKGVADKYWSVRGRPDAVNVAWSSSPYAESRFATPRIATV